jgi:hypothetical protein
MLKGGKEHIVVSVGAVATAEENVETKLTTCDTLLVLLQVKSQAVMVTV